MTKFKPLRTEQDYKAALTEIDSLIDAEPGSPRGDRRDVLIILVDHLVRNLEVDDRLNPIDTIKAYMQRKNFTAEDLCQVIKTSPADSAEILNKQKALRVADIRRLHAAWRLPLEVLVSPYEIDSGKGGKTEVVMKPRWPHQHSTASLGTSRKIPR